MRVCQIIEHSAQFPEMFKTAFALKFEYGLDVVLCMANSTARQRQSATMQGFQVMNLSADRIGGETPEWHPILSTKTHIGTKGKIRAFIKNSSYYKKLKVHFLEKYARKTSLIYLARYVLQLKQQLHLAKTVISKLGPDVVLLPHIDIFGVSNSMLIEAQRSDIPVVVVPYAWITRKEAHYSISNLPEYRVKGLISRWVQARWPQWVFEGQMYLPVVKILAYQIVGLRIPIPWMADSQADRIALESEAMRKSYIRDGVPEDKCVITGSVTLDILSKAIERKINPRGRAFFLVLLPPDQTGNSLPEFQYPDYWTMICAWVDACMATANNAIPIFSIHPRMQGALEERLRSKWPDIEIYEEDACNLIPYADFCVSELSGMMRYALACGCPLLYFDVYKYGFLEADFNHNQLFSRVSNSDEFILELARFQLRRINTDEIIDTQSKHWGALDCGAARRLASLLQSLSGTCGLSSIKI